MNAYLLKMSNQLPKLILADDYALAEDGSGIRFMNNTRLHEVRTFQGRVLEINNCGRADEDNGIAAVHDIAITQ